MFIEGEGLSRLDYVLKFKAYVNTCEYGVNWHWEGSDPTIEQFDDGEIRVTLDEWDLGVVGPLIVSSMNGLLDGRLTDDVLKAYSIWVKDWEFELRVLEDREGNLLSEVLEGTSEDVRAIYLSLEYTLYLDHGFGYELEQISTDDVFDLLLQKIDGFVI